MEITMAFLSYYGGFVIIAALLVPYFIYVHLSERKLRGRHELAKRRTTDE